MISETESELSIFIASSPFNAENTLNSTSSKSDNKSTIKASSSTIRMECYFIMQLATVMLGIEKNLFIVKIYYNKQDFIFLPKLQLYILMVAI